MRTLLISYDLRGHETSDDYKKLIDYIKSYSSWAKPLYSQWLVKTEKDCPTVREEVKAKIDSNDKLLVLDVTGDASAWYNLSEDVAKWIQQNL